MTPRILALALALALTLVAAAAPARAADEPAADPKAADAAKDDPDLAELVKGLKAVKAGKRADYIAKELMGTTCTLSGTITAYKQLAYHRNGDKAEDAMILVKADREEVYLKPEDDIDPKKLPYAVHSPIKAACRVIGQSDDAHLILAPTGKIVARPGH
jgi:hypothetical protein